MSTDFDTEGSIIDFSVGSEVGWNSFVKVVPANIIVYTTDTKFFKRGDGIHKFKDLANGPSIAGIASHTTDTNTILTQLPDISGGLIVVDNETFVASATLISDIHQRIQTLQNTDDIQSVDLNIIQTDLGFVNENITNSDNGKIVVIQNHQMNPGALPSSLVSLTASVSLNITSIELYSNKNCTLRQSALYQNETSYIKISASDDINSTTILAFALIIQNDSTDATIVNLLNGVFSIVPTVIPNSGIFTMVASVSNGVDTITRTVPMTVMIDPNNV